MAGPEPYPQETWTIEQERAYAEGRANAQGANGKGPASRSAVRKRRVVRTEAGARRYGVPIGAEIGSARNATAAEAQKDTESTDRYNSLVGTDPQAQARAMRGLNDDQLQRLSRVAYSWRTADPNVVRLRVGVANELRRRGMDVNNFGGLGRPQKPTGPARRSSKAVPKPGKKKGKAVPGSHSTEGIKAAMSRMYGKDRKLSVPQLRAALDRFGHMRSDKREVVARFLVNQAVELSVPHFLGRSVIEAANLPDARQTEVIELAGRWKHGWIPLDAVAMRSKMKGGNGKPWWSGGKQTRRGSASSMRRSIEAGKAQREGRTVPRTKTSNNKDVSKVSGGKPKPFIAIPKKGGQRNVVTHEEIVRKGGPVVPGTRRVVGSGGSRKDLVNNTETRRKYAAIQLSPEGRQRVREAGVKAAEKKAQAKVRRAELNSKYKAAGQRYITSRTEDELRADIRKYETGVWSPAELKVLPSLRRELRNRESGKSTQNVEIRRELDAREAAARAKAPIPSKASGLRVSSSRTDVVKSSPKPERGSKMGNTTAPAGNTKVTAAEQKMINQMAERYAEIHGSAGARSRAAKVRAEGGDMNLAMADALEKAAKAGRSSSGKA